MKNAQLHDAVIASAAALVFLALVGLLGALAVVLVVRALAVTAATSLLLAAAGSSLLLAAIVLPPAMLLGVFLSLYWVEYRDDRFAVIGRRIGREMARLPDLFVAVALVALVSRGERSSRALLCVAAFVPALVYVATATSSLLDAVVPVYRGAALALGVRRHRWILASLRRIALRPLLGIGLCAFGRVLTAVAPLLVLSPRFAPAPLPLELLRDHRAPEGALLALALLCIVLVTKGVGRAMLAPGKVALTPDRTR